MVQPVIGKVSGCLVSSLGYDKFLMDLLLEIWDMFPFSPSVLGRFVLARRDLNVKTRVKLFRQWAELTGTALLRTRNNFLKRGVA